MGTEWTSTFKVDRRWIVKIQPGFLDRLAADINAKSDKDLATFLGLTEKQLENLRYGGELTEVDAAVLVARRSAHLKAAEILNPAVA